VNKILNGAIVGVVAFVVLAPVVAWIMPKSDAPAPEGSGVEADGTSNPFVPIPNGGSSSADGPSAPGTSGDSGDVPTKDVKEGHGLISFNVNRAGAEDEDDHRDDDRRERRKHKH
jgi:hypothetical protein